MTLSEAKQVFAEIMKASRTLALTEKERHALRTAIQVIRYQKRAGRNPKTRKPHKLNNIIKTDALWEVTDAARETRRASESGILDLSEQKRVWRDAVDNAREAGATESEIKAAEKASMPRLNPRLPVRLDERRRENPYRLGQRRIYPVKRKKSVLRYRGSLPSRRETYTKKSDALARANPPRPVRLGRVVELRYKREGRRRGYYKHVYKSGPGLWIFPDGSVRIQ